ncbi:MAG: global cell cycle regulator GcrA-like protein [Alphaproteobacteria bacterium]|nr:global cell cycle regulator GcrA-like protein [Alphaproteobacteria bacterium]
MVWTDEKVNNLKKLWAKGTSTAEIARRLGLSKNSIIGKVHRLNLDTRPSPLKKKKNVVAPQKAVSHPKKHKISILDLKLNTCRWPIGEPTDPDFHFCGENTVVGKPYCAKHCILAYTTIKESTQGTKSE